MVTWMVFQSVRRCSHARQEGTGTAPSELSACVLPGELYVLLTETPYQLSKACQGAARGKQSQLRKESLRLLGGIGWFSEGPGGQRWGHGRI